MAEQKDSNVIAFPGNTNQAEAAGQPQPVPQQPADGIRAFDQQGREVIVPREEWRQNVLPGMVKEVWNSPDQLYMILVNSLNEGFFTEMEDAAQRLYETDPLPARGACMWGIVLTQAGRLDEAEGVLTGYGKNNPADGSVLLNLAKVYADQGHRERAHATLWSALEIEPNLENGLGWYAADAQQKAVAEAGEQAGQQAARTALERIAAMPTSWRAQLWLARMELVAGTLDRAKQLYAEALTRAPSPVPPDFLMQMSGDLGEGGHLRELIEFTLPTFVPEVHGLPVGNNLIKALVDSGDYTAAEAIRSALQAQNRPDWQGPLGFWESEIARRRPGSTASQQQIAQPQQIQVGMLRVDGPVWLPPNSPGRRIFAIAPPVASVTFLGGTAESPEQQAPELADALGRLTRALPLFLAEQVEMRTAAEGRAMLPWAVGPTSGFVVSGARWPEETAVQAVSDPASSSDYVVSVHIDGEVDPWTAELAFLRTHTGARIGELSVEFPAGKPEQAVVQLADEVVDLLASMGSAQTPEAYQLPEASELSSYLMRLEQLMAVRCATMDGVPAQFLSGEREILEAELELCLAQPTNVPVRLLLVETLGAMQRVRPEAVAEFRPRFDQLVVEQPLPVVDAAFSV